MEGKNIEKLKTTNFFDLKQTIAEKFLEGFMFPWEALPDISKAVRDIGKRLDKDEYYIAGEDIWISKTATVAESASVKGPVIIGHNAQVRHCAFIRGGVIIGENAVVGNSTELKNVILFNSVQVPHFNYIGDSILGYKSHFGAGAITSNVKSDKSDVNIKLEESPIETGLRKFGAIVGDYVEIGCNSVLNPGTVIGKNTNIYPLSMVRGVVSENSIYKNPKSVVVKKP